MLGNIPLLRGLGIVGLANLSLLCLIAMWRTYIYVISQRKANAFHLFSTQKKVILHVLLVLAVVVDLPMYVSLVVIEDYNYITYSFHKFQSMFLLAAYSITINDWSSVLYSIQEIKRLPLVFRTGFLVFVNTVFSLFCIFDFAVIIAVRDVDRYTGTLTYKISIMLQISVTLALTLFMLYAGLGLSWRLQGVSGMLASEGRIDGSPQLSSASPALSLGFKTALNRLIVVMITCSLCIFMQMSLMIVNYTAGYAEDKDKSPGPPLFFWTFYAWLPLWGPILAMLHLSRSRVNKEDDYDTTSHRVRTEHTRRTPRFRSKGEFGDLAQDSLLRSEFADFNEEGDTHDDELGSALMGQQQGSMSHHSNISGISATSHTSSIGGSQYSSLAGSSVYRPPDYPSSLFKSVVDEAMEYDHHYNDDGSSRSDSMQISQSDFQSRASTSIDRESGLRSLLEVNNEGDLYDDRGSSEDDQEHYQYNRGNYSIRLTDDPDYSTSFIDRNNNNTTDGSS